MGSMLPYIAAPWIPWVSIGLNLLWFASIRPNRSADQEVKPMGGHASFLLRLLQWPG